jgi:putative acetyltransferase
MLPLHHDPQCTFRFADDRIIPRFHLEGIEAGRQVSVFRIDLASNERRELLATAVVGEGGWVDLREPITVRAGDTFIAVPGLPTLIRPETTVDLEAVRNVNRRAFAQQAEANLVDALRDGGHVRVSLVAEYEGQVVGHILFSDLLIITPTGPFPVLALAPLAVLPELQRQGIGSALVQAGLEACRTLEHRAVVVLGHPSYYPRFGFSSGLARRLEAPFSGEAFMALELQPGALAGVTGRVQYPPPFAEVEE